MLLAIRSNASAGVIFVNHTEPDDKPLTLAPSILRRILGWLDLLSGTPAEDVMQGQPEPQFGLLNSWGSVMRLPEPVGHLAAKRLIFNGRMIESRESLAHGLVDAAALTVIKRTLSAQPFAKRHANREEGPARSATWLRDHDNRLRSDVFFTTIGSMSSVYS